MVRRGARGRQSTFHLLKCTSPPATAPLNTKWPFVCRSLLFHLYSGQNLYFMIDTLHPRNDPKLSPTAQLGTARPPPVATVGKLAKMLLLY